MLFRSFEGRGFYPDFILWIKTKKDQRIIFIEPHGMLHAEAYDHDEKARLHESMPELSQTICSRSTYRNITLDSYIVSATPYGDLRKRYGDGSWDRVRFAKAHILFPDSDSEFDYIGTIFRCPL